MDRHNRPIPTGGPNWMPWVGLMLVLPAVIVFLVGISGLLSSVSRGPSGHIRLGDGPGVMGLGGALVVSIAAFIGLMMGVLGTVRGLRKNSPRDGTNVGLAGSIFDVGVIVLAILALASLVWLAV